MEALIEKVKTLRNFTHGRLTLNSALTLLEIMEMHPDPWNNIELSKATEVCESAVSRQLDVLTDRTRRNGERGYGLVISERDDQDRKQHLNRLSAKGVRLKKALGL